MEFHFKNDVMPDVPNFCNSKDKVYIYHDNYFVGNMHNYFLLCEDGLELARPIIRSATGVFDEPELKIIREFEKRLVFNHIKIQKIDISDIEDVNENIIY